ncbi:MAG: GspH/FimT family protein [Kiloniellales bacterium]
MRWWSDTGEPMNRLASSAQTPLGFRRISGDARSRLPMSACVTTCAHRYDPSRRLNGFTLLELLVVLAVLGLVYALALPSLSGVLAGPRLDREARQLVSALREARSNAIVGGREVAFTVDAAAGAWRYGDRRGLVNRRLSLSLQTPPGGVGGAERPAIRFFSDGGSTGGHLTLKGEAGVRRIHVHWLTGRVTQIRR